MGHLILFHCRRVEGLFIACILSSWHAEIALVIELTDLTGLELQILDDCTLQDYIAKGR